MTRFDFRRLAQVVAAFTGLVFDLYSPLLFVRVVRAIRRQPRSESRSRARQIRLTLERLGATFIKFGQLLAMRPDLLPSVYIEELSKLLDDVPGYDPRVAISIIEHELGNTIDKIFAVFEEQPVAAASFAQVHKARLVTGEWVAVKVQRPSLDKTVNTDLKLLSLVGNLVDLSGIMNRVRLRPLVKDFIEWTHEELDYTVEATYAERLRQSAWDNPCAYIPKVFWNYTTRKVLTLEFLQGIWVSDILEAINKGDKAAINAMMEDGIDLRQVARNIYYNGLQQVFENALFHADPHAGNLVVLEDNVIGYVDFGIVGQLDDEFRSIQLSLITALEEEKPDRFFDALLRLLKPPPENVDLEALAAEVKRNMRYWENGFYNRKASLEQRSTAWLFTRNLNAVRKYGLSFSDLAVRYYRALGVAELIVLRLDTTFDVRIGLRIFTTRLGIRRLIADTSPQHILRTGLRTRLLLQTVTPKLMDLLNLVDIERQTLRTAVSGIRSTLSSVFKGLAVAGGIALLLLSLLRFLFPQVYALFIPVDWRLIFIVLAIAVPFWAWVSRRLYITSVRQGKFVSPNRRS